MNRLARAQNCCTPAMLREMLMLSNERGAHGPWPVNASTPICLSVFSVLLHTTSLANPCEHPVPSGHRLRARVCVCGEEENASVWMRIQVVNLRACVHVSVCFSCTYTYVCVC